MLSTLSLVLFSAAPYSIPWVRERAAVAVELDASRGKNP